MNTGLGKLNPDALRKKGVMKGFDYFTPEKRESAREMENRFKAVVESFGFREIEGPLLQPIEFYLVKSGEELLAHAYVFEDTDGSQLVLRPELTPTVAYMIAREEGRLSFPLRWWSNPDLFRKENPQRGRKRQFKQLNADIFDRADSGRERSFDDAEIIALALSIFESFELTQEDIVMKINSRSLVERLFDIMSLDASQRANLLSLMDKSGKISDEEFSAKLEEIAHQKAEFLRRWLAMKSLEEIASDGQLGSLAKSQEFRELAKVFELMGAYGMLDYCEFSPCIVRGLGYYTGTVFEAFDRKPEHGFGRALMGGGRYDNLTKDLGGKLDITGVGFGFGNVPLEEIMESRNRRVEASLAPAGYFVAVQSAEQRVEGVKLARELRKQGKVVALDDSISKASPDKISSQLSRANKKGFKHAILIFPDEWQKGKVIVKDMQSGEQEAVDLVSLTGKHRLEFVTDIA